MTSLGDTSLYTYIYLIKPRDCKFFGLITSEGCKNFSNVIIELDFTENLQDPRLLRVTEISSQQGRCGVTKNMVHMYRSLEDIQCLLHKRHFRCVWY